MTPLTPAGQATLDALREGPGNVHEVCERTGRSRSATDRTQADLATAGLIIRNDLGEPADGAPIRWRIADQPPADTADEVATMADQPLAVEQPPKRCRGCQTLMPATCPACWQKTPSYCGACRRDRPDTEPQILANGLPRLRPGELPQLVGQVMRDNPLPEHLGVVGWTASRVAVYLPGRSTGAVGNALDKLTRAGTAQLIGEHPTRYRLTPPADGTPQ